MGNPASNNDESGGGGVRINLVAHDQVVARRVQSYSARKKDWCLGITIKPANIDETDVYVLPHDLIESFFDTSFLKPLRKESDGLPVMGYGSPSFLRNAFLLGCVDYIKEPWVPEELELRLGAIIGRMECSRYFDWGVLRFRGRSVEGDRGICNLSYQEYRILKLLIENRGSVVSRDALFYAIWNRVSEEKSRVVDVHVSSLRKKLRGLYDIPAERNVIISVRTLGYVIS